MKKRKIEDVKDLPEWFDIKKYAKARTLDAKGWFNQLIVRRAGMPDKYIIQLEQGDCFYARDPALKVEFDRWYQQHVSIIRKMGIVTEKETEELNYFKKFAEASATQKNVHLTSLFEIYWAAKKIPEDKVELFNNHTIPLPRSSMPATRAKMFKESFLSHSTNSPKTTDVFFTVNLNCPDDIILSEMKNELEKIRQNLAVRKEKKKISPFNFYKWAEFGVLPYYDLTEWALQNDIKIPNKVLAQAIFQDASKGEENIRRTTKPLAGEFVNLRTLSVLQSAIQNPERFLG